MFADFARRIRQGLVYQNVTDSALLDGLCSRAVHRIAVVLTERQQCRVGEPIQQLPSGSSPILPQRGAEGKGDDQQEPCTVGEPSPQSDKDEHADHSLGEWKADAKSVNHP